MSSPTSEEPAPAARRRRVLRPALTHTGLLGVLLLVVLSLVYTAPAPPPPAIAEIAPAAVQQIKQAQPDQASSSGSGHGAGRGAGPGHGGGGGRSATSAPSAPPHGPVVNVPSVLNCVGTPPQQIEDPQSPPCVGSWKGDNGGATAPGVTGTEIRIAIPDEDGSGSSPATELQVLLNFFNRRFEFYGRRLVVAGPTGTHTADCSPAQQAAAAAADSQYNIFASVWYWSCFGYTYNAELARRHVLAIAADPIYTDTQLGQYAPYVWQYQMSANRMLGTLGDYVCQTLAHRPAAKAGKSNTTPLNTATRKFGLLISQDTSDQTLDATPLRQVLRACGVPLAVDTTFANQGAGEDATPISQMKNAGVTTIICLCSYTSGGSGYSHDATALQYEPEWVVTGIGFNDFSSEISEYWDPDQVNRILGFTVQPRQESLPNDPAWWAYVEASGGASVAARQNFDKGGFWALREFYHSLLMLASGIQMAGPRLTPETFQFGLQHTDFPNPDTPINAGHVGFQGGSFAMTTDATMFYYSASGQSPYTQDPPGAICYVDHGHRYTDTWPRSDAGLLSSSCDSGAAGP